VAAQPPGAAGAALGAATESAPRASGRELDENHWGNEMDERDRPLAGVRILEVTQFEVATVCGQQLAWLGAEVVKIEEPGKGDPARSIIEEFFATLNSSKRGITLNLKTDEGRRIFLELVEWADVVIENLAPGTFERLGFTYEVLAGVNPRVIFARAKGYGTYGPQAGHKSFDMIAQAVSGAMAATGPPEGPPMLERFPVADNATGIHLALGIMAALWQRERTGEGQQVESTLQDAMASMGRTWYAQHLGGRPSARGNGRGPAGGLYPCAPGGPYDYVYVFCHRHRQPHWDALFSTIGRDDLRLADAEGDPVARHQEHEDDIDRSLTEWTSARTKHEAMAILGDAGVPCGAVLTAEEALDDPHLRAREMVVEVEHPTRGPMTILGSPVKLSGSSPNIFAGPLVLGEHTEEVLDELLGYPAERVAELRADGVV
jgi:formyl-CoA transferase